MVSQAISSPSAVIVPPPKNRLRKDSPRRLNPFVVHGAAHGRNVHPDAIGDLLHLERFDEFGALVKKDLLVIDDRPSDLEQRVAALLDRFDQPAGD